MFCFVYSVSMCCSVYCFMCQCVLYYSYRLSTQLQLTNISYHMSYHCNIAPSLSALRISYYKYLLQRYDNVIFKHPSVITARRTRSLTLLCDMCQFLIILASFVTTLTSRQFVLKSVNMYSSFMTVVF